MSFVIVSGVASFKSIVKRLQNSDKNGLCSCVNLKTKARTDMGQFSSVTSCRLYTEETELIALLLL